MADLDNILLGLDMGYTGCKAVAFNARGRIVQSAYREYSVTYSGPGRVEMDPEHIWKEACSAIREVTTALSAPVDAMSVSVMGEAFTPVNADGRPVTSTITAFDERGKDQCQALVNKLGARRIFDITGQISQPSHPLPKICWLQQNEPEIYKSTDKFFCFGEFVFQRLGVPPTIDYSMAARSMAFDVHQRKWSEPILEAANLDPDLLPAFAPAGTVLGSPHPEVAKSLGLDRSTKIVVGGHDTPCGALGAAVVGQGQASYTLGTVHSMCAVMSKFNSSLGDAGFPCYPHVVPEQFVTIAYTFAGGSILRWFRDTFAEVEAAKAKIQGQDPYDVLLTDIPDSPGELFLVPHFSGTGTPWFDMQARGSILGLTLNTKRSEIVKAILEGTAHELATNAGILESAGLPIQELHAIGGSAKSKKDIQLRTNIMNRTVKVMKVTEACAFGAALLAGVGVGVYESVEAASCQLVELENAYTPEPEIAKQYAIRQAAYEDIHQKLREIYTQLQSIL